MNKRWPLHPKPYKCQLLYSWVEHLAEIYGVSYQSFCQNVLKLTPQEISYLYISLPEKALIILSNGTNIPIDNLRERSLDTMFQKLMQELKEMEPIPPKKFSHSLLRLGLQRNV